MIKFLHNPYPISLRLIVQMRNHFLVGCFVAVFLLFFQPFDIDIWVSPFKTLKLLGFGVVAFICPVIVNLVTRILFNNDKLEQSWKVYNEIIIVMTILVSIAFGNLLYVHILDIAKVSFESILGALFGVLVIGVFPVFGNILLNYNKYKGLNEKGAAELNVSLLENENQNSHSNVFLKKSVNFKEVLNYENTFKKEVDEILNLQVESQVILSAENEKDILQLDLKAFICIESADNYSNVVFWKDNRIHKQLLRGTLKRFENQLEGFSKITRCHRSFIVNLNEIENITGNAQGYRALMKGTELSVPIARNYGKSVLQKLKN